MNGSAVRFVRVLSGALCLAALVACVSTANGQQTVTILNETFEGNFPEDNGWQLIGSPNWNDTDAMSYEGGWSGYCAGTLRPYGPYEPNMSAWMIYGPFSLADAASAQVTLIQSYQCESNYDFVKYLVSVDGNYFSLCQSYSGWNHGWTPVTLDLTSTPLGNLCGQPAVWFAIHFTSDGTVEQEGAYVDNIVIQKTLPRVPYSLTVRSSPYSGDTIAVSPSDEFGEGDGLTAFARTYYSGTDVTLTAPLVFRGAQFTGWSGVDSQNGTTAHVTMNSDRDVTANYASGTARRIGVGSSPYSVTVGVSPSDTGGHGASVTSFHLDYIGDVLVTLTAPSVNSVGQPFTGWSGDIDSQNGTTAYVTMSFDGMYVTANYAAAPPSLSVTPSGHDFGSVNVGSSADQNFTVQNTGGGTLAGSANVSAPFSVVSGGTYSLTAGQSQTVTVRFTPASVGSFNQSVMFTGAGGASRSVTGTGTPAQALITVQANPSNGGTGSGGGTYNVGQQVQISASANSGWTFNSWSDGGAQTHTITVPAGGGIYTASFTQDASQGINLALASRGSTITGSNGKNWGQLIDGIMSGYTGSSGYGYTVWSGVSGAPGKMTLDLKVVCTIHDMKMLLWNLNSRYYRYKIESSVNGTTWTLIVNRTTGTWKGWQDMPFGTPVQARYLRLTGTYNSANSGFHVVEWQVFGTAPANLALASRGSTISGSNGANWAKLIDGTTTGYTGTSGFGYTVWTGVPGAPGTMTLNLQAPCTISGMKMLLWNLDSRYYRYKIEASLNGTTWTPVVNRTTGSWRGWQDLVFGTPVQAQYLRLTGTYNSANHGFHVVEWQVFGGVTAGLRATAEAGLSSPPAASPPAASLLTAKPPEKAVQYLDAIPVNVLTSGGSADYSNGWNVVDGDTNTAWQGQWGAGGWWVALVYDPIVPMSNVVVDWAEGSLTNLLFLYSSDATNWFRIQPPMTNGPVKVNYLWLIFPADPTATNRVPAVREIWTE